MVWEAGVQGVKAHPTKFQYVENSGKILENPGKICVNLGKISENLCKIPENLGKNCAQRGLIRKNGAQRLHNHINSGVFKTL